MTGDGWLRSADRALELATRHIKVIRAVTPTNAERELADLERAFRAGSPRMPRWSYDPTPVPVELCRALEKLAAFLEGLSPLGLVYAERARELCLEAAIIDAVGSPSLRVRARERFVPDTPEGKSDRLAADDLAHAWGRAPAPMDPRENPDADLTRTCDQGHPASLVSRMASEVGRARLPVRVIVQPGLASLAATGDGVIFVAAHRWIGRRDVERTVLHEIAGHALPRARAQAASFGIFAIGTAFGIDDQEGRALSIEEAAGFLDVSRRRELGLRHLAATRTLEGQNLVDVVEALVGLGATMADAVRIAARVQRGGCGSGGLAREIVYLPAYLRVGRALCGPFAAVVDAMMSSGRIASHVAPIVASGAPEGQKGPENWACPTFRTRDVLPLGEYKIGWGQAGTHGERKAI